MNDKQYDTTIKSIFFALGFVLVWVALSCSSYLRHDLALFLSYVAAFTLCVAHVSQKKNLHFTTRPVVIAELVVLATIALACANYIPDIYRLGINFVAQAVLIHAVWSMCALCAEEER